MTNIENSLAEVIEYLKGIREDDVKKISPKFMNFLIENASKDYQPKIDYTKPLSQLNITNTSKVIICFICYKYWCENEKEKESFYKLLQDNDQYYEKNWKIEKNMFKSKAKRKEDNIDNDVTTNLIIKKDNKSGFLFKIKNFIKNIFNKKGE